MGCEWEDPPRCLGLAVSNQQSAVAAICPRYRLPTQSGVVEDPTARIETSCARTGRPRRHLRTTQQSRAFIDQETSVCGPVEGVHILLLSQPRFRVRYLTAGGQKIEGLSGFNLYRGQSFAVCGKSQQGLGTPTLKDVETVDVEQAITPACAVCSPFPGSMSLMEMTDTLERLQHGGRLHIVTVIHSAFSVLTSICTSTGRSSISFTRRLLVESTFPFYLFSWR